MAGRAPVGRRADLRAGRDLLATVWARVDAAVGEGRSLQEVVALRPAAEYHERWNTPLIPTERFVGILYEAAAGKRARAAADSAAIRAAALDYIEGWYGGDAVRMERALHPELAKRIVRSRNGASTLGHMGMEELVEGTRRGGGSRTPAEHRRADVRILDVFGNAASVRVDAATWVDYLHLGRIDGQWKIINVLWETRPRGS